MYDSFGNWHDDPTEGEVTDLIVEHRHQRQQAEAKQQANAYWNQQVAEFQAEHPDVDLGALNEDKDFLKFVKGKNVLLKEAYADYRELVGGKAGGGNRHNVSGTGSGNAFNPGSGAGLTAEQRQLVDQFNKENPRMKMTYKQFAGRL